MKENGINDVFSICVRHYHFDLSILTMLITNKERRRNKRQNKERNTEISHHTWQSIKRDKHRTEEVAVYFQ